MYVYEESHLMDPTRWFFSVIRGVEIHFSPGVQFLGDTSVPGTYVEENCHLEIY